MTYDVLNPIKKEPALLCTDVKKRYSSNNVLDGLDLKLESGRIAGLLGPNGSGKTTLLKIIAGLLTPESGEVRVSGMKVGVESKKAVSYLPDRCYLNDWMKVSELIAFFADFYEDFETDKANEMLARLSIDGGAKLKTLSKGTKEKVQLILVMSRKAKLYLLDEPIGGVDPAARDYIIHTIIQNYREDASVLISTHLIADVESALDDAFFISGGKILLASPAEKLREERGKSVDEIFREIYRL